MVSSKPSNAGFTLIELLIVIAITAILAAVALPAMNRLVASHRAYNRADQLLAMFQFARAEAIRTNTPVLICPTLIRKNTSTSNTCVNFGDYENGTKWQGFIAFSDNDLDGAYNASKDTSVRTVALNQNYDDNINKIKVKMHWGVCKNGKADCKDEIAESKMLAFMPNGQFGLGNGKNSSNWDIGQSSVALEVTDAKYEDIKRRIIITPSGKPIACYGKSGNDSVSNTQICTSQLFN